MKLKPAEVSLYNKDKASQPILTRAFANNLYKKANANENFKQL